MKYLHSIIESCYCVPYAIPRTIQNFSINELENLLKDSKIIVYRIHNGCCGLSETVHYHCSRCCMVNNEINLRKKNTNYIAYDTY